MASMNMEEQFEEQLESLSREDLVTLVRKLLLEKNEAQKQLETTKKEAGESAKQAEEFSQRNIQLEQEKAKVHADLRQKLAEIEDMHKEMEEKSKDTAEKANQIDALLLQLNESSHQHPMNLPPSSRVPLPLELNCEIFKCLKLPIQRKFIWGLGRDIYGMFGQKLLKKTKRVRNPRGNRCNGANTRAIVAADGLSVSITKGFLSVFAVRPFPTSGPQCRVDGFPGTILYYYEIKANGCCFLGLSGIDTSGWINQNSNSFGISIIVGHHCYGCWLAGELHRFELPEGAIRPLQKANGNVFGCGIVLNPDNKLAIFFTLNGKLRGRKIPISPTVDRLFPAVSISMMPADESIEANFGGDPGKPFEYDIENCPGLELACI